MKIAQIAPPWISIPPQTYGGTENVIHHLVEELVTLGHDVTLFAPADARTSAKHVSFIPRALLKDGPVSQASLKAYYHLHKSLEFVAEHHFDIVHTHLSSGGDMYIFPLLARLHTPHVTTLHNAFSFTDAWSKETDQYFREWIQNTPLISISESARHQVVFPANVVGTVHHGIPMSTYRPENNTNANYLVWMGRFVYEKGAHLAIEAARKTQVPLILAGVKESYNRDAMNYYHYMIEPYLDDQQIRYIGPVSAQQKIHLLQQARALLQPLQFEDPSGIVMIEAMATGCPVIAYARGVAPEIIVHGQTGFLVHTMDDMVNAIDHVGEIKRSCVHEHTQQNFSASKMAKNYMSIYTEVMNTRHIPVSEFSSLLASPHIELAHGR
ncbi:MAG TPA: glycosyltransferase family 4 protein [Dictyobacter sp.]|nr:glycosyltransferase family 4 protein [Dictyobacter sp.]